MTKENTHKNLIELCNKQSDCCATKEDCIYAWFTGSCHTQEYVSKIVRDAREKGMNIGEAQKRENVTCTCEDSKCVTYG